MRQSEAGRADEGRVLDVNISHLEFRLIKYKII